MLFKQSSVSPVLMKGALASIQVPGSIPAVRGRFINGAGIVSVLLLVNSRKNMIIGIPKESLAGE
ncbi:MAG: hypothetical protein II152_01240, partial [Succinivibrionaceae bacterium]|nr:hypothetical protein [Succinivibrionaceae bacterium]